MWESSLPVRRRCDVPIARGRVAGETTRKTRQRKTRSFVESSGNEPKCRRKKTLRSCASPYSFSSSAAPRRYLRSVRSQARALFTFFRAGPIAVRPATRRDPLRGAAAASPRVLDRGVAARPATVAATSPRRGRGVAPRGCSAAASPRVPRLSPLSVSPSAATPCNATARSRSPPYRPKRGKRLRARRTGRKLWPP